MSTMTDHEIVEAEPGRGYGFSGKIMLSAVVILFAVVVFMVVLHLYARWYLIRLRRRQRRAGRTHVVLADNHRPSAAVDRGLEPAVLKTLPVSLYSSEAEQPQLECAVCLSEFEEKEILRLLPKCNHAFHIECIDMWFHSHSTCPLCRTTVEPVVNRAEPVEVADGLGQGSGSELCAACQECGDDCTTSSGGMRKGLEVRIDVPPRRIQLENELTHSSPMSRMLSFKRILSMGIRSPVGSRVTTPCGAGTSRGTGEPDLESGLGESTRAPTPRSARAKEL